MSQCTCATDKEITCIVHPTAMRVECYWNLHKGGWSVRCLDREHPSYNRVIAVVPEIYICDPKFVVQPAGNAKVRRESKKNVHAFVRGHYYRVFGAFGEVAIEHGVTYNPYVHTHFVSREEGGPVYSADLAHLYTDEEGKGKVTAQWYEQPCREVCSEVQQVSCPPGQEEGSQEARVQR